MRTSHALLLRYYHDPQFDFSKIKVEYIDRGAPGDRSSVDGEDISNLDRDYFEVLSDWGTKPIPYHRILRISYMGLPVWERE